MEDTSTCQTPAEKQLRRSMSSKPRLRKQKPNTKKPQLVTRKNNSETSIPWCWGHLAGGRRLNSQQHRRTAERQIRGARRRCVGSSKRWADQSGSRRAHRSPVIRPNWNHVARRLNQNLDRGGNSVLERKIKRVEGSFQFIPARLFISFWPRSLMQASWRRVNVYNCLRSRLAFP